MMRLELRAEAEVELFEAALRYERERSGLGTRFKGQIHELFLRIMSL